MDTKAYEYNQNNKTWKNEAGNPVNTSRVQAALRSRLEILEAKTGAAPPMEEKKPIIADKKELLAQSSYLTRLNSQGCRETSRNKTAFIVSVTFNSKEFPQIKERNSVYKQINMTKVFQIIRNQEYKNVVKVLNDSEFKSDTNGVANIFRFFDAETNQLICVGYAKYKNSSGQNALQAKPTKLEVQKIKGTTKLNTIFQHFLHDWAASFDLNELQIIEDGKSDKTSIPKDERQLYAAQNRCGMNSDAMSWSVSRQGAITTAEKLQEQYSYQGSKLPDLLNKVLSVYIGPQILEETLKQFDIIGKSFRSSPFEKSNLFKIYYCAQPRKQNFQWHHSNFASLFLNDVEQALMGEARGIGYALRMEREGAKYKRKLEKQGRTKKQVMSNVIEIPLDGGGGRRRDMPRQDLYAIDGLSHMKTNLINGNFGQIEEIADVLAKNGYERFTIKKIGNDDAGTLANAFLNNPQNKNYVKEFADLVKQCRFKMDCISKVKLEELYDKINKLFDEFVDGILLTGYKNKQIVIVDNYPSLKEKYINFFINLQQRIRRSSKGRGKLTDAEKSQIENDYMPVKGEKEEGQVVKKTTQISNFFMDLWSGLMGKVFRKRNKEVFINPDAFPPIERHVINPIYEPAVGRANNNESDAGHVYNVPVFATTNKSDAGHVYNKLVFANNENNNENYNERRRQAATALNPRNIQTNKERREAKRNTRREARARQIAQKKANRAAMAAQKKARERQKQIENKARETRTLQKKEAAAKQRDNTVREAAAANAFFPNPAFKKPDSTVYKTGNNPNYTNADTEYADIEPEYADIEPEYAKVRNNSMPRPNTPLHFTQANDTNYVPPTPTPIAEAKGNNNNSTSNPDPNKSIKFFIKSLGLSEKKAIKRQKEGRERARQINRAQKNKNLLPWLTRGGTKKIKKTKKNVTKKNVTKKKLGRLKKRKGKKGKTHRAAKKTGRRYYLKTLKKRK